MATHQDLEVVAFRRLVGGACVESDIPEVSEVLQLSSQDARHG